MTQRPSKTFIIAEAGVNHNGDLAMALQLIDVAASSGADAVKFQTFQAASLVTESAPKAQYQLANTNNADSQFHMLQALELAPAAHETLIRHAAQRNIQFLSTPFDLVSLQLLSDTLNLPRLKFASGEITNAPLLLTAARSDKPIILSTGMATLSDIEMALAILAFGYLDKVTLKPTMAQFWDAYRAPAGQAALAEKISLLHCTTDYPAAFGDVNLRVLDTLSSAFGLPVGYSDHTQGIAIAIAAVARGASIIEKHFTLDQSLPGPDHKASLNPQELTAMVSGIRNVEKALGSARKIPTAAEWGNRAVARKSIITAKSILAGERFTENNLTLKRPGTGVSGIYYYDWLGEAAPRDYQANEIITDDQYELTSS